MIKNGLHACVSRKIVEGEPVSIAYREHSKGPGDSGWKLLSGTESAQYAANPDNSCPVKIGDIKKAYPNIKPLLNAKVGSIFEVDEMGNFVLKAEDEELNCLNAKLCTKRVYVASPGVSVATNTDYKSKLFKKL